MDKRKANTPFIDSVSDWILSSFPPSYGSNFSYFGHAWECSNIM